MALAIRLYSILIIFLIFNTNPISGYGRLYNSKLGNTYYIESDYKYSWQEALIGCMEMNMTLATMQTEAKSDEIIEVIKSNFVQNVHLWVGGIMTRYPQRHYTWLSTGNHFTYTNWASTQPDYHDNSEYCVLIGHISDLKWNDLVCLANNGYICETDQKLLQQVDKEEKVQLDIQEREKREKMLQQEVDNLKSSLKQHEAKHLQEEQKLKQELVNYQEKSKKTELEIQEGENREKTLQQELETLKSSLELQKAKHLQDEQKLTQDLENYQQKLKKIESEIQEGENQKKTLQQELETLKQQEAKHLQDKQKLKTYLENYQQKFKKIELDIQERENHKKTLQQELETLKQQGEKYLLDEEYLKQELVNYQQKFEKLENGNAEEDVQQIDQLKGKRIPINIFHFHQDRYGAN